MECGITFAGLHGAFVEIFEEGRVMLGEAETMLHDFAFECAMVVKVGACQGCHSPTHSCRQEWQKGLLGEQHGALRGQGEEPLHFLFHGCPASWDRCRSR